jgi:heme/copper-type cytochrome/quinol oxidase subunit 4
LTQQPFRDELGDRRRSTLLYFYIGVASSALAVVLAQKLPSFRSPLLAVAILGAGIAILFLVHFLRSNDEREQQINYRALTFAFTGTLVFSALVGFLQVFGFHSVPWLGIPALMICCAASD